MEVRVLGQIEIHDGHRLAIGGPTQRRIVAVLAMAANETVSLDRLVDITWPERTPDQAETNLRSYIYRIRRGLGDNYAARLETSPAGYRLHLDEDELDVSRFDRLVIRGEQVLARGDPATAVAYVDEALKHWHGPPYEEFADESWVLAEAHRLSERRLEALMCKARALLDLGDAQDAVHALEEVVVDQPLSQQPRELLMLALHRAGRQADSLRVLQDFRGVLGNEIGLDLPAEIVELEARILQHDPELAAAPVTRSARSYELSEVVGEGAFAVVWKATQPELGRAVAVKQIRAGLANNPDFIRRFEVEAQLVASLEHPYIVPLYDYWREPDAAFLVLRLLTEGTLADRLSAGLLDEAEVRRLVEQIGSALRFSHESGIVHRDIKPANVLLDALGNFYLTDFGIAFGIEGDDELAELISTGEPAYAAPEQLRRAEVDARSDIYSFGVTLYEAATGRHPFADESTTEGLLRKQLEETLPAPSEVQPELPAWFDILIRRATAKTPDARYSDIDALLADVPAAGVDEDDDNGRRRMLSPARNPYKSMASFSEADVADFHGRDALVARLVEVLARPGVGGRLVTLVGPSGSGKTSVIRAGLIPALRAGTPPDAAGWYIATMAPGQRPFEELEAALSRVAATTTRLASSGLLSEEKAIGRAVKAVLPDDRAELVLVIDHFEELFTLVPSESTRLAFLDGLVDAVNDHRSRLRLVLAIRADFFDRPLAHAEFAEILDRSTVAVGPMRAQELEQVIVAPAAAQGVDYEPGLASRIIGDVIDQPGALPLLQYTLTRLFENRISGLILETSYDDLGGIHGAVARRADEAYADLDDAERDAARRLFGRLVRLGPDGGMTRARVLRSELASDDATERVLDGFGVARLLSLGRDAVTRSPTVEIAHEALIDSWPRLSDWLDEDRQALRVQGELRAAADGWNANGRSPDELYRGTRLEVATSMAVSHPHLLNDVEASFVAAGQEQATQSTRTARRRTRTLQTLLVAVGVLLIVAVVAGLVALERADEASRERDAARAAEDIAAQGLADAEAARADAESARAEADAAADQLAKTVDQLSTELLGRRVQDLAGDDPVLATLVATELANLDPGPDTLDILARTVLSIDGWLGTVPGYWIDASSDGRVVVTAEPDRLVVRDPADLSELRSIRVTPTDRGAAARPVVSPDGTRVAFTEPGVIRVADIATGEVGPATALTVGFPLTRQITWSHDSNHLVVVTSATTAAVLGVEDLRAVPRFEAEVPIELEDPWLETHPNEPTIGVASAGTVLILDTSQLDAGVLDVGERFDLDNAFSSVLSFTEDGSLLAPVFGRSDVAIIQDGEVQSAEGLPPSARRFLARQLSDGSILVADGNGGAAEVVSPDTGRTIDGPWRATGAHTFLDAVEVHDGDAVALVRSDGTIHLWSRVGGNILSDTLPPFPGEGAGLFFYPDSGVIMPPSSTDVWAIGDGGPRPVDFGVANPDGVRVSRTDDGDVAVVIDDGRATLHELPDGRRIGAAIDVGSSSGAMVTPDRSHMAVQIPSGIAVYDLETGKQLATFDSGLTQTSFNALNETFFLVHASNGSAETTQTLIVDVATLEQLYLAPGAGTTATADGSAAIINRGNGPAMVELATGDVLWSVPTGLLGTPVSDDYVVVWFDATQFLHYPSGKAVGPRIPGNSWAEYGDVITQVRDGRLHRWRLPADWLDAACRAAGRSLTLEEWDAHIGSDVPYDPACRLGT